MRVRSLVLCMALLLGVVLSAAGCSSSAKPVPVPRGPVGTPTGTVTVKSGGKVVCVIKLDKHGTGTCKVSTAGDAPGNVTYTGTYSGDREFRSVSGSTTVTLLPPKQAGPAVSSAGPGST